MQKRAHTLISGFSHNISDTFLRHACLSLPVMVLGVVLAATASPQQVSAGQGFGNQPAGNASKQQPGKLRQPLHATVKDGKISASFNAVPLTSVLNEVSRASQVPIIVSPGVGSATISLELQQLPLEEALRILLKGLDYFELYSTKAATAGGGLKVVWVYPAGGAAGIEPTPPEQWASVKELKAMLKNQDPAVRATAIEGLAERLQGQAGEELRQSLTDGDEEVRARALYAAENHGINLSYSDLEVLLKGDPSANVRFLALQGLQSSPGAVSAAISALGDPDPNLRELAREILERQRAAENPQPPAPQGQQQSQANRPH